jgi:hypothetical protein
MRTDQLIDLLASNLKPVDRRLLSQRFHIALVIGSAATFGETCLFIDARQAFDDDLGSFFAQLFFASFVVATTKVFLLRAAHPGAEIWGFPALASFPIGAIVAFAAVGLALTSRFSISVDSSSLVCLVYIPLLAIAPFASVAWALRAGAPTQLARAGAAAGLLSGTLGASACALPCANNLYVAVALCHGLALEICTGVGAGLGLRVLRW